MFVKLMEGEQIDLNGYEKENYGTEVLVALNGRWLGNIIISRILSVFFENNPLICADIWKNIVNFAIA